MNRTAVVTGGASGLGRASAERLAHDGVDVVTLDIAAGADILADVRDPGAVSAAAQRIGPVDILINSAGVIGPNKPLWETTADEWAAVFAVNVQGTVNLCRAFVPGMRQRGWGRIVNFASMAGKDGNPNLSAYSASKGAVIAMTKSLGKELATSGVLVNARRTGGHRSTHERRDRTRGARAPGQPHPDEPAGTRGRGRRAGRLACLRQVQLLHRRRLRHQRRPRHLLRSCISSCPRSTRPGGPPCSSGWRR